VLSNEKGQFKISLDSNQQQHMTLVTAALSYRSDRARARVRVLSFSGGEAIYNIRLETEFVSLPEIVILSDIGIRGLMRRVIERIPDNYGAEKYLLKAYHRSYFASDVDFAQLNEAYVVIEDGPYLNEGKKAGRSWINQLRQPETPAGLPPHIAKFFGSQALFINAYFWQSNPIRSHSIWMFGMQNMLDKLTFRQTGEYLSGQDTLVRIQYEIDPERQDTGRWVGYAGHDFAEVLINKTDLAILSYRQWTRNETMYQEAAYRKIDGKYYFQRGSFSWALKSDFYQFPKLFNTFLYVTDVITDPDEMKRVEKRKRLRWGDSMNDLNLKYRPEYWQGEERLLQLPADETVRLQLEEIMGVQVDSMRRDTSK
jgi:hypothetical protein